MVDWIISRIPHRISKILFVYGSYEFLAMLEGKIREAPFFKVQSGKITVWPAQAKIQLLTTSSSLGLFYEMKGLVFIMINLLILAILNVM